MPNTSKGPSGSITLYDDWSESANSHKEETKKAVLSAQDGQLVLEIEHENENFMPGGGTDRSNTRYVIDAKKLADLIKKHGERA